jgi:TrmH family RNA methyltransferase
MHNLFLVEGTKAVQEFLDSELDLHSLFCLEHSVFSGRSDAQVVTERDLARVSNLKTPNQVIGLFVMPERPVPSDQGLGLVLDRVNDPGNLGTIIRLCDWFGVDQLICSPDTVDCYNPKVVQATMGSLARVEIIYMELDEFIASAKRPVFATGMTGSDIYSADLPDKALVLLGSESHGLDDGLMNKAQAVLTIPQFGKVKDAESLNVGMATAIVLSEFRRRGQ